MAHVQISPNDDGSYRLLVDGVDISKAVIANSVEINFDHSTIGGRITPIVRIGLAVHSLDADLPEALLLAERADEDGA